MTTRGPISAALEQQVRTALRERGLVLWIDPEQQYTAFVDDLAERAAGGDFVAPVLAFRGSYLETILALEPYGNGQDPEPLLLHVPGHSDQQLKATPFLELYKAGSRFMPQLQAVVREAASGRVGLHEIDQYLSGDGLTLEGADAWLQGRTEGERNAFQQYLEHLTPTWLVDAIWGDSRELADKMASATDIPVLADYLYRQTGLDEAFIAFMHPKETPGFRQLSEAYVAWLLCVEYVFDLKRPPHLTQLQPLLQLPETLRAWCRKSVSYLRERYPETYQTKADEVETLLQAELDAIAPTDLGEIDTFRREEASVLEGAIAALEREDWQQARLWAETRTQRASFWLQRDPVRRVEWTLVREAADLGQTVADSGRPLKGSASLRTAVAYYVETGHAVDRKHRRFEQQRLRLLDPQLPHFGKLLDIADRLRSAYRSWADDLAQDMATICADHGFLPEPELQQRTLFEQIVLPLTQTGQKVALFLVDAFRFEMATELLSEFTEAGTTVTLKGRLAELPSITAVGMNALAPVTRQGRLELAGNEGFRGFRAGEYVVAKPADRVRAMGDRSVDNVAKGRKATRSLELSDVCTRSESGLKSSCHDAELIVVHSTEIDDAGEANVGLATFETWLQQLKTAWHRLKAVGVTEFVFTADHGFMLLDQTTAETPYGSKKDPSRRHVLMDEPRQEEGTITVSLQTLGYDGREGYLLFRRDTALFATGQSGASFAHGGNSLQERVIPVLSVSHRLAPTVAVTEYVIEARAEKPVLGYNHLQVRIIPAPSSQGVLDFVSTRPIDIAIRALEREDIRAVIKDAPGVAVANDTLRLEVGSDWTDVYFALEGTHSERVRIMLFHPDRVEKVGDRPLEDYFAVSSGPGSGTETTTPTDTTWHDDFDDAGVRAVFLHLEKHGAVTEADLLHFLGSPRSVRRFALAFDGYATKVPFAVRIETSASGKRYVKE